MLNSSLLFLSCSIKIKKMKKFSLFFKIFIIYLLIMLALSFLILLFSFKITKDFYISRLADNLKNLNVALSLSVIPFLEEDRFEDLDTLVKDLSNQIQAKVTVIGPEGVVLADSRDDPASMGNQRTNPEIIRALKGNTGKSIRFNSATQEEMLYLALPVKKEGKILGVVCTGVSLESINSSLTKLKINILYSVAFLIGLFIVAILFFSRHLSRPIRQLVNFSSRVTSGDFPVKPFLKNRGELKKLVDNFNYMADRVKTLFTELHQSKEQLSSIISSLQEGVLLVDKEGRIILYNESFKNIIQSNFIRGKFYWEVIREPSFSQLIEKVKDNEKISFTGELKFQNRIFLCRATFVKSRGETAIILQDITELKRMEKMKEDFLANISHELRTPLTAIKGFIETLEEEVNENLRSQVQIIKKHTDRLINILRDLLVLSELEGKDTVLRVEKVKVDNLIKKVVSIFGQRLKEKKLILNFDVEQDVPFIKADPFKLEQMFINLIDNAIKYTEKGGIYISVKKIGGEQIFVEITDTGIGIPQEHLPRIFERFYVVDKSRSRTLGGTGLGLSIVKHIVLLHKGSIDVKSIPGSGTTFYITLPVNPW